MPIVPNRLSERATKITNEEVQAIVENANEENLSIRSLMAKQESNVIITDPREYQLELFEKAKKQNIIAVLDTGQYIGLSPNVSPANTLTGSGKTLIAVLLLKHTIDIELDDRAMGKKRRISFFLVSFSPYYSISMDHNSYIGGLCDTCFPAVRST